MDKHKKTKKTREVRTTEAVAKMNPQGFMDAYQKALDHLAQGMGEATAEDIIGGTTRAFTGQQAVEMAKRVAAKLFPPET
jgi:hypothetical protein